MSNTTFDRPNLSAFTRLYDLGLEVTGQRIETDHAVLACRITGADRWCRRCGCQGICRDTLGRTLKRRAGDILAYFDHPHTSNGPTEAINGRLEHLRGSALGFRNLTHYITRCLLETGGFRPQLHPQL